MKILLLRPDVYVCRTDDGCVLMDLTTGRYFGLDLRCTLALAPRIKGWPSDVGVVNYEHESVGETELARLINALTSDPALLTDAPELGKAVTFPAVCQKAAIPFAGNIVPWPRIRLRHISAFCQAYLQAVFGIKCRSLAMTVRRFQRRKSRHRHGRPDQANIVELVRVFRFIRPVFYTAKERCLFDSLTLVEFMAAFGIFPTWVIGVRTRPFAAHSWVVSDGLLLNERLETAEEFSPILAV